MLVHPNVKAQREWYARAHAGNKSILAPKSTQEVIADPDKGRAVVHCGLCPVMFRLGYCAIEDHHLSHRPQTEAELAQAERNRAAARIITVTTWPCGLCGREMTPGEGQHVCPGVPPAVLEQQARDRAREKAAFKTAVEDALN